MSDSLPPLPFDKLWKIEMAYHDTSFTKIKIDSFYIQLRAGNILSGDLSLNQLLRKRLLCNLSLHGSKDSDFSEVHDYNGAINLDCLTKNFFQEFGFSLQKKIRNLQYYETAKLSYTPTWFIASGILQLKNSLWATRYFEQSRKNFPSAHSNFIFNYPTIIGNINTNTEFLFQNQLYSIFRLNDFITLGDNFFIKPEITYDIKKTRLGTSVVNGFFIKNLNCLTHFSKKQTELCYFDTLYQHVHPILVNNDLDYPINDWQASVSLSIKHHQISFDYRQYQSYITFNLQDSWLIPSNNHNKYQQYIGKLQNRWRFLNSSAVLSYIPEGLILIPNYIFAESLQIIVGNFDINLNVFIASKRSCYQQRLSSYWLFTPEIGYNLIFSPSNQLRKLRFFLSAENIFDHKYEILPNKLNFGRKFTIGFAYFQL